MVMLHHAIGFEAEGPAQVFVAGVEGLEVHGLVVVGGAVEVPAGSVGEFLEELAAGLGALEGHVLKQVGHAGFAIAFVARADPIDDVDRDFGLGVVGKQQDMQAVRECIFRDAFDGGNLLNAGRQRLCEGRNGDYEDTGDCGEESLQAHGLASLD